MPTAREIQILLTIQANAQAAQTVNNALASISKEAQQVGRQLERAFSPRLIQSQQQLQQQLFQSAKALQAWLAQGSQVTRLAPALEKAMQLAAARMIELSTATNISVKDLQALQSQFAAITPAATRSAAVVETVTTSLGTMAPAMEKVTREMGSFTPNATNAQKAGQGLILSFSLSQAAAGNFSQALFGLGFSLLFVGPQMLNVVTIASALSAALGGIAIEKLTAHFKSETVPVTQKVAENLQKINEGLAEMRGEAALAVEALQSLVEEGKGQALLAFEAKRTADHIEEIGTSANRAARLLVQGIGGSALTNKVSELGITSRRAAEIFEELGREGFVSSQELEQALIAASLAAAGLEASGTAAMIAIAVGANAARAEIVALFAAREQGIADAAAEEVRAAPFEAERKEAQRSFEIQQEMAGQASSAANAASSQARQERVRLLRRALDDELSVHRAHIDQIKDVLDERLDVIRTASEEEIRLIRERVENVIVAQRRALQDSIDDMKDAADARIGAVKDAADKELDINKERINALKEQERDLADALKDLARQRQEAIRDVLTTEEELAALEQLRRQQGDDPALQREIALREARLRALLEEQDAIDEQTDLLEDQLKSMEDLIEAAEDRADQIKDNRDAAIKAIKDELAEAQKAARRRSEDEIRAIQRTRDADVRAARDAADARVDAARMAADQRIGQVEAVMARLRRQSQDEIAGIQAAQRAAGAAAAQRRRNDRDALQAILDNIDARNKESQALADQAKFYRDVILPAIRDINAELTGTAQERVKTLIGLLESLNVPRELWDEFIPFITANLFGLQTAGTVPGPIGQPQLVVAHGGEEIRSSQVTKHARDGASVAGVLTVILEARGESISMSEMRKLKSVLNRSLGKDIEVHLRSRRLIA